MENHGQKRTAEEQNDLLEGVKAILLDIEGTTTPISFVKDKLFPYVRDNVKKHFEGHWEEEECQGDIEALRAQATEDKDEKGVVEIPDKKANQEDIISAAVSNVLAAMDSDAKTTGLKQLQGHMWREAYKTGKIQGEIFEDVVLAMKDWVSAEIKLYVYSSGSEEAQKLLFGYSDKGDLTEFLSGYFDTKVGPKTDKDSYTKIAEKIDVDGEDVLFLTDLPDEAKAAAEAGLRTCVVVRDGNTPLSELDIQRFNAVTSFTEIFGMCDDDLPAKRLEGEDDDDDDDLDGDDDLDDDDDLDGEDADDLEAEGQEKAEPEEDDD